MMLRQSPRRNQRSKGMKVKHVLQVSLLLGLCIWLLFYQMPRLSDDESSSHQGIKSTKKLSNAIGIKLGRKDLKPKKEIQEEIEDEKQNEGQAEENKPREEKSEHVDETKHNVENQDEEEGRGDKEKDEGKRGGDEKKVEEDGKHHEAESTESNAKNDTKESKEKKIQETTNGKPGDENATKEEKKQLESDGDGLTNNSSSTEKVGRDEKKANVMKQKEFDESSKGNDTAASPVEVRSSEQGSASDNNSSPRTAPAPSSTTQNHKSAE